MRRPLLALIASLATVGLLATGAATLVQTIPASTSAATAASITWKDCTPRGFQCATLPVPVDYTKPTGPTLDLALIRLPAKDPATRIGSLLANPGGPGGSAIDFLKGWAPGLASTIRNRFDLVAFDPRGVGLSTPIICHDTLQQFVAVDPSPDTPAEWTAAQNAARKFAGDCVKKYPDLINYVGTKNVARDMESVRIALGEDKLTYVGYSYGTAIGAVYADMYPGRVRAFVLDGAVDLSQGFEDINRTQMAGFERAFQAYLANCRASRCALAANGDPGAAVDKLLAQVETKPIPAPSADRPAGPGETLLGIISAMYSSSQWPRLTSALVSAVNGDGSGLVDLSDQYLERNPDGSYPNLIEANIAVNYADETCPKDPSAYIAMADRFAKASPHFGASAASSSLVCAYWPVTPDPLAAPKATGAPPIIVISTTNDPATPYEWGVAMSQQLESGKLIIHRGEGHTIYAQGDACIDAAVNAYLLQLTVPEPGKSCGTGAPPPESIGSTPTPTAAPSASRTASPTAPGLPDTGAPTKDGGSGHVAFFAIAFVAIAILGAGAIALIHRPR